MNGLNSGTMPSQAALANGREQRRQAARPAKRAKRVMPIIGETRMTRSGCAGGHRRRIERVLHRQRAAVGEADECKGARTGCAGAPRAPQAAWPPTSRPIRCRSVRRHGAVRRAAGWRWRQSRIAIAARDVPQAEGRIGQAVQQHHGADRRPGRFEDVGAVEVLREVPRIDRRCRRNSGSPAAALAARACPSLRCERQRRFLLPRRDSDSSRRHRASAAFIS